MNDSFIKWLGCYKCTLDAQISKFQGAHLLRTHKIPLTGEKAIENRIETDDTEWVVSYSASSVADRPDAVDLTITFKLLKGTVLEANVGASLCFNAWDRDNYVLMPAALYNGNRFESRILKYPPQVKNPADIGPDVPTIISDIPRLNINDGTSGIQQMTRDLATPAIGFYDPKCAAGFWLLTHQDTRLGDSGIDMEENYDRSRAVITITAPGVRHNYRYSVCDTKYPCNDRGADFHEGYIG